jgi:hypothetical protein
MFPDCAALKPMPCESWRALSAPTLPLLAKAFDLFSSHQVHRLLLSYPVTLMRIYGPFFLSCSLSKLLATEVNKSQFQCFINQNAFCLKLGEQKLGIKSKLEN